MKARAVIPNGQGNASNRWRIEQPFRLLNNYGHDAKYYTLDEYEEGDNIDLKDSVVILHRIIPGNSEYYIRRLREQGAYKILYSMDDFTINKEALEEYLYSSGGITKAAVKAITDRIPKQIDLIQRCDGIIFSTRELRDIVLNEIKLPRHDLYIIDNAIDLSEYMECLDAVPKYQHQSEYVYIGWAGGRRPESDFIAMAPAWEELAYKYSNIRFVVGGWQPETIDKYIPLDRKIRLPWRKFSDYPRTMQVDIGCCPLADTRFNQGKSDIKFMEYTIAGAAVVASPTVYSNSIYNSVSGYIAQDTRDWYEYLEDLILDSKSRNRKVDRATYEVVNYYSLDAKYEEWQEMLDDS